MGSISGYVLNSVDTTANWTTNDPVVPKGMFVIEETTLGEYKLKLGDGTSTWSQLSYYGTLTGVAAANHTHTLSDVTDFDDSAYEPADEAILKADEHQVLSTSFTVNSRILDVSGNQTFSLGTQTPIQRWNLTDDTVLNDISADGGFCAVLYVVPNDHAFSFNTTKYLVVEGEINAELTNLLYLSWSGSASDKVDVLIRQRPE